MYEWIAGPPTRIGLFMIEYGDEEFDLLHMDSEVKPGDGWHDDVAEFRLLTTIQWHMEIQPRVKG